MTQRIWTLLATGLIGWAGRSELEGSRAGDHAPPAPTAAAVDSPAADPAGLPSDADLIVRLFYGDRDRLGQLASQYDLFAHANHDAGYVVACLREAEYRELLAAGYRLELDAARTARANRRLVRGLNQPKGFPNFSCYRTVEETQAAMTQLATQYPGLVTLIDIGDSWEKTQPGGQAGYDLLVLALSNQARPGPKPRFFLMAEHHARELVTAETALRFAEELVARYGSDPDVTWLLDYQEVHVLPLANPDGHKWAELGWYWRKNTDNTNGCTAFPNYGTDLNRNFGFKWGSTGASPDPCSALFFGAAPFSEPENQAIRDYVRTLFPDQRGPADTDPAPLDATGLMISLHSYGQLVLYPWGWTTNASPNAAALRTLGGKFGFYNRHWVGPSVELYPTSGTADEWAYAELGVAAFTFEMGNDFFEDCANFENTIYPGNRQALYYAAKAARQPYRAPAGPDVVQVSVTPTAGVAGAPVSLVAVVEANRSFGLEGLARTSLVEAARYSLDAPSWIDGVVTYPLSATDGQFGSAKETVEAALDTTAWPTGRHTLFVEGRGTGSDWGVPTAVFLWIEPLTLTATLGPDGLVLQWPSVANRFYTVLRGDHLGAPFSVLAEHLPATPPTNTVTEVLGDTAARFYRVLLEP